MTSATGQTTASGSRMRGGRRADDLGDQRQQVLQQQVLAAEDVALADPAASPAPAHAPRPRRPHARCSGRYRCRPAPARPRRRRIILPVGVGLMSRGPTGAAGLTITTGSAFVPHQIQHRPLGPVFRPLVDADEVRLVGRRGLVRRRAVADLARARRRSCNGRCAPPRPPARRASSPRVPSTLARSMASGSGTQIR